MTMKSPSWLTTSLLDGIALLNSWWAATHTPKKLISGAWDVWLVRSCEESRCSRALRPSTSLRKYCSGLDLQLTAIWKTWRSISTKASLKFYTWKENRTETKCCLALIQTWWISSLECSSLILARECQSSKFCDIPISNSFTTTNKSGVLRKPKWTWSSISMITKNCPLRTIGQWFIKKSRIKKY